MIVCQKCKTGSLAALRKRMLIYVMLDLQILTAFVVKHLICDFLLQRWPYLFSHKGDYGHPGGILHALIHTAGTAIVCIVYLPHVLIWAPVVDGLIHYHVDFLKMQLNAKYKLTPKDEWFWHLIGIDQTLHYITYIGIMFFALP